MFSRITKSAVLQSFIFLKLAIAGHLTIFVARNRGPFWPPSRQAPFLVCSDYEIAGNFSCSVWNLCVPHRMETERFCLALRTDSFCYNGLDESEVLQAAGSSLIDF